MSKVEGILELEITPERALACCRQAFAELGWELHDQAGQRLEAREDIAGLPCHHSPAKTTVAAESADGGCALVIVTRVPGFGPISSSHARGRHEAVVRRVYSRARS